MKKANLILAALVIFIAGMTGGVALSDLRWKNRVRKERERRDLVSSPLGYRLEFLRRVQRELNLTPDQQARIEDHIRRSQDRFRTLWQPVAPEVRSEMEEVRSRIRAELTPEQRERFDRMLRERPRRGEVQGGRAGDPPRAGRPSRNAAETEKP